MAKTLFIVTDRVGNGDDELGRLLMRNFLYSAARNSELPSAILLSNGGVRLACTGSESLDDLRLLAEAGVAVKACGTCLDFLGLADELAVGEVGNMVGLVGTLLGSGDVVTIA